MTGGLRKEGSVGNARVSCGGAGGAGGAGVGKRGSGLNHSHHPWIRHNITRVEVKRLPNIIRPPGSSSGYWKILGLDSKYEDWSCYYRR